MISMENSSKTRNKYRLSKLQLKKNCLALIVLHWYMCTNNYLDLAMLVQYNLLYQHRYH